jgi:hypothetical protein
LALAVVAIIFAPSQKSAAAKLAAKLHIPEDSMLRRHFLTHVRHQEPLLADALEKRLAKAR